MKSHRVLYVALVFTLALSGLSAQFSITGRVVGNSNLNVGLEGVVVTLSGNSVYTDTTNIGGQFNFTGIPGNQSYTYTASAEGFTDTTGILEVAQSDIIMGDIILNEVAMPPLGVTSEVIQDNLVSIHWSHPNSSVFDDFEAYEDFSIEFGNWTLHDVDMSENYTYTGVTFPHMSEPIAYIIFNPETTTPPIYGMTAHSGSKFTASFASFIGPNNDWMITPLLDGVGEFRFWARSYVADYGLERFKVGVSTSGTLPQSFNIISGPGYIEAPTEWTEYIFDLSAYSGQDIYVGIQCVSNDAFIFMVDDVRGSYYADEVEHKLPSGSEDRHLLGYKVWRLNQGEEDNEASWTALTPYTITGFEYQDLNWSDLPMGDYKWAVKAVYSNNLLSPPAFSNSIAYGMPGYLQGSVKDFDTGQPLEGVSIEAGASTCSSDANGSYLMTLEPGEYTVTASKEGYLPNSYTNILITPHNTTFQIIWLASERISPSNFSASVQDRDVYLSWLPPALDLAKSPSLRSKGHARADDRLVLNGYKIYRDEMLISQINDPAITELIDYNLECGTYVYSITALYDTGESYPSTITVIVTNYPVLLMIDEGFENYPDFSLDFGDWTVVDWDGYPTAVIPGHEFPNSGSPMAFMIFNPAQTIPPLEDVYPFEGQKMAAAFCSPDAVGFDWMITPRIQLGENSRVKFTAMSYSQPLHYGNFNLGVSTMEDLEFLIFHDVTSGGSVGIPREWTTFEYDLSAYNNQEVFIGLRSTSLDITAIFVDDFKVYSGPVPVFSITPESFSFGVQLVTVTATQEFVITNVGADGLIITNVELDGSEMFQIVDTQFPDLPIILQASESQSLVIRYLPTDIGNHHATLRITDNMDDNPHLVEISGVGIPLSNTDGQSPELTTRLLGNYPNPFNPVTSIRYSLKERGPVTLEIYNLKGQMVRRLENSVKSAGEHSVAWDGKDAHGSELGSGVYFYKLSSGSYSDSGKMIMLK